MRLHTCWSCLGMLNKLIRMLQVSSLPVEFISHEDGGEYSTSSYLSSTFKLTLHS